MRPIQAYDLRQRPASTSMQLVHTEEIIGLLRGRRLPTGAEVVVAVYRRGGGACGHVGSDAPPIRLSSA
jgi:hypothetical protein